MKSQASDIQIEKVKQEDLKPKPDPEKLLFGHQFSDHMLSIEWNSTSGWGRPLIHPLRNISLHPAAKVFHYAVELYEGLKAYRGGDNKVRIFRPDLNMERMYSTAERAMLPAFEGMKAYRGPDKKVRLFRPDQNARRLLSSAERSVMPTFDVHELVECMKKLISVDQEWVPYHPTSTLYIRPTLIGSEPSLGVAKTHDALLFVITGPVGPYYPTGFKPVSLLADPKYVRASKGGVGRYKMGSNYAPTIYIQIEALEKYDCQQVLWLYGDNHQVTEVGTMNFFLYWINEEGEKELVTPSLESGLILPGVTRKSLLELASTWGDIKITERDLYMNEIIKGLKENRVKEIFGAGTACVVSPVEKIIYDGKTYNIPTMAEDAPVTMRLYKELTDIQYGRVKSDWSVEID
ncbi:hypothetical protein LSH36_275g09029 [Paralvinella palmiformis]|uniref:Branched-chain-amino-acid aminotransferase n=1 Tax=Paralvinella palmiformis TaxID=53620 RepID=A0AAD9JJH3_9ANNE|nr:hypothetical protein LSH36_275g09029 [Paralvinella palmiformis]